MKWTLVTLPFIGHVLSSKESSFPGLYFAWKFLCIMSTIGLTKNRGSWFASPFLWVGLIWITDMKIPQDVLKIISGHVVAKNGMLRMLFLLQYCSREFFLRMPITIRWATNTFISIGLVSSPIIQLCTRILANTLTQQFNSVFVPIVFCLSEFCMNIFISIFTQYCRHSIFKKTHQKLHLDCILLNPCSFNRIPQIYIYIWVASIFLKPNQTTLFIFWINFIIW